MIVLEAYPPNIETIHKEIPPTETKYACFTYGKVIYNPSGGYIDECVGFHEATHSLQQEAVGGPEAWWDRWLNDVKFRAEQELKGYQNQYRRFCELHKDRNAQSVELHRLATDLASPMYGGVMSYLKARELIRPFS